MDLWRVDGLRVVELGSGISAAFGARLLADFGADVIKVEAAEGDETRRTGPFPDGEPDLEQSGLFLYLNHGKRGVTADLSSTTGAEFLGRLVQDADVVIENLGAAEFSRLSLPAGRLPERLVVCSISPYGQDGPKSGYLGSELCAYASGGMMFMTGGADRPPVKHGLHQAEHLAGVNAAAATLAAVMLARRTGAGQRIDISLQETVALTGFPALNVYTHAGAVVKRAPATLPQLMTSQAMRASDGWVMPSDAGIDVWWEAFAGYLERPELLEPPFESSAGRRLRHEELDRIVGDAFRSRTRDDLFHEGQARGLTVSSIQTPGEIVDCPHLEERDFFVQQEHPVAGTVRMPGMVPLTGAIGRRVSAAAPLLGQDNEQVSAALGGLAGPSSAARRRGRRTRAEDARQAPLDGVRILELGMVFVLPLAITPLAALGADVIKVEAASRPDSARWGPQPDNEVRPGYYDHSGNFHYLNRNKRGVTIDLRRPAGRDLLLQLVAKSDVVAENFTPRVLANLGLSYERLREVNPRIILLSSSGFGQTGPWKNYKAYGPITEAIDGLMHLTGYDDGPPVRGGAGGWGVAFTDVAGAYYGTYSILAALEHRERTGEGLWVDLSHYEAGVATVPEAILDYTMNGRVQRRTGNRDPWRCPQGAYPCAGEDRWLAISVQTDGQFAALCRVLRLDAGVGERFGAAHARRGAQDELDEMIAAATRAHDAGDLEQALQAAGVAAAVVASSRDVWLDPQLRHRGFVQMSPAPAYAPGIGARPFPRPAWRMSGGSFPSRAAPAFGEHTREVLTEVLKMSDEAVNRLFREGVLAAAPRDGLVNPWPMELEGALTAGRLREVDPEYRSKFPDDVGREGRFRRDEVEPGRG